MSMFVLTLIQPYAQLVVEGLKRYEFSTKRPGREKWGKRIGIHAAQTFASVYDVQKTIEIIEQHGPGVVGIVDQKASLEMLKRALDEPSWFHRSRIIGSAKMRVPVKVKDILREGNPAGFNLDLWALPLINPRKLVKSVYAVGRPTIWWHEGPLRNMRGD